ncbi:MAG: PspA/IM30 family protein [Bacillota bacterium]
MGFFEALKAFFQRLFKRSVSQEELAKNMLGELENSLQEAKSGLAVAITVEKKLKALVAQHRAESEKYQKKAEEAVQKGDEELAREYIGKKHSHERDLESALSQYNDQVEQIKFMKGNIEKLEKQIEEAKLRRENLVARGKSAKAQRKVMETMRYETGDSPSYILNKMEEEVVHEETRVKVISELDKSTPGEKKEKQGPDRKIEEELEALKAKFDK